MQAAGGLTGATSAFLVGGYYGSWLRADPAWDLPFTNAALQDAGAALGAGILYAFPSGQCGLVAAARVTDTWPARRPASVGPACTGWPRWPTRWTNIAVGRSRPRWRSASSSSSTRFGAGGACHYPDGVIRFVATALDVFADEVARHDANGRCLAGEPTPLPIPAGDGGWR